MNARIEMVLTTLDIINPEEGVEININKEGILLVSVDGITRLRVKAKPADYFIIDEREGKHSGR